MFIMRPKILEPRVEIDQIIEFESREYIVKEYRKVWWNGFRTACIAIVEYTDSEKNQGAYRTARPIELGF